MNSKNECISNLKKQLTTANAEISKMKEFEIEINGQIERATKMNEDTNQQLLSSKEAYDTSLTALGNEKSAAIAEAEKFRKKATVIESRMSKLIEEYKNLGDKYSTLIIENSELKFVTNTLVRTFY